MLTATYPKLGSKVEYVRQDLKTGTLENGTGHVIAMYLDPSKRVMVQVKTAEGNPFNVDLNCINPSEGFKEIFKAVTAEVQRLSEEGNKEAAQVVEDYNARVEQTYNGVLGEPVVFQE